MAFDAKKLAGEKCCRRYQKDYIARANARSESATLECIKFYTDGAIRFEQHCYGEAASCVFTLMGTGMDPDGTLHWTLPKKGYYNADVLPTALVRVDENDWLYFDEDKRPWKLAIELDEDPGAGYTKLKMLLRKLTGK